MSTGISRENTTIAASSSSSSRVRACVRAYVCVVCVYVCLYGMVHSRILIILPFLNVRTFFLQKMRPCIQVYVCFFI
mgnify:CR=1 FL=1